MKKKQEIIKICSEIWNLERFNIITNIYPEITQQLEKSLAEQVEFIIKEINSSNKAFCEICNGKGVILDLSRNVHQCQCQIN